MTWNLTMKYQTTKHTVVQIQKTDPFAQLQAELPLESFHLTDRELIDLALEDFFNRTYQSRAMDESIQLVHETIPEFKGFMDGSKKDIESMQKQLEVTQGALMEMFESLAGDLLAETTEEPLEGGE